MRRTPSPVGDSTLITSAPKSARWRAAPGPANTVAMSITRMSLNADMGQTLRMTDATFRLQAFPVHLGLGATADPQEEFTGSPDWYQRYGERHASDGQEGRLVSMFTFTEPWTTWEMHPNGHELVCCVDGEM